MADKIAILGASGFVGSTLVEYLWTHDGYDVTPFAHSSGGATCLAHRGLMFEQLDLLDRPALTRALAGFDYVVNCARGDDIVMLKGMDNLIQAAKRANVKKIVHLSSVAIYGDPPHPDSRSESAPAEPGATGYGAIKLAQDVKLQQAASRGLGAVILCPPNIIGPYSEYVIDVINSIEANRFRLLDDGRHVINVVDVGNLCAAIVAAIRSEVADGRRLFVCEPEPLTWAQFCAALEPVIRRPYSIESMPSEAFHPRRPASQPAPKASGNALKHLISDEVREAFRRHPTWAAIEGAAKDAVRLLGNKAENYMRDVANGPIKVDMAQLETPLDTVLIAQQLRQVRHDPTESFATLGFQPIRSFDQSMSAFRQWYGEFFDIESQAWQLLAEGLRNDG
ncbi:NAD-dependent epimerase/dehydratase family protein [Salinisphaera sp. SPP-AMP-43]|uniref:NAD-dependent epimerase/dehydratase family protein n=1 Tax=Salinisphaera sp. SPP-AMP-43 TaxID=3121288 RepID=UPI003C6DEA69